jgi:hypothetical protein
MKMTDIPFANTYADPSRAAAYAGLAFPGTYHLAFRDLPAFSFDNIQADLKAGLLRELAGLLKPGGRRWLCLDQ